VRTHFFDGYSRRDRAQVSGRSCLLAAPRFTRLPPGWTPHTCYESDSEVLWIQDETWPANGASDDATAVRCPSTCATTGPMPLRDAGFDATRPRPGWPKGCCRPAGDGPESLFTSIRPR